MPVLGAYLSAQRFNLAFWPQIALERCALW
jgi:hypothetical protein